MQVRYQAALRPESFLRNLQNILINTLRSENSIIYATDVSIGSTTTLEISCVACRLTRNSIEFAVRTKKPALSNSWIYLTPCS